MDEHGPGQAIGEYSLVDEQNQARRVSGYRGVFSISTKHLMNAA